MKTRNKALLLALCALLLVVTTVFATLAYLTDTENAVTNTFTVGKVSITLTEAKVDVYGKLVDADGNVVMDAAGAELAERVTDNTYKLIPGASYVKDPTIEIEEGSEPSWIFAKVPTINGITVNIGEKWICVDETDGIYAYNDVVKYEEGENAVNDNDYVVFDTMTVGDIDVTNLSNEKFIINAYAIQAEGFDSYSEAWGALAKEMEDANA